MMASICAHLTSFAQEQLVPVAVQGATFSAASAGAFQELRAGLPLAAGSRIKTVEGGWAKLAWGPQGALEFLLRGELSIVEIRPPTRAVPSAAFVPLDSALKATLTHNDATVPAPESVSAGVGVGLSTGTLLAFADKAAIEVKSGNGKVTTRAARFAVSAETPGETRVTVDFGTVTIAPAGGRPFDVAAGETVKVSGAGATLAVTGPAPAKDVAAARADTIALRAAQAGRLAPIADSKDLKALLAPIAEGPPGPVGAGAVGSGLSAPFDLAGPPNEPVPAKPKKKAALLTPANPANLSPPVNSPERP